MKKICSMLLACMMILTGFSMPAFADGEWEILVPQLENLKEDQVNKLECKVRDVFEAIKRKENFDARKGLLLDGMCCAQLLNYYYRWKGEKGKFIEYTIKAKICAVELIRYCIAENDPKNVNFLKYKVIHLGCAISLAPSYLKKEIILAIGDEYKNCKKELLHKFHAEGLYSECKRTEEIVNEIHMESCRRGYLLDDELLNNMKPLFTYHSDIFNGSELFDWYNAASCKVKVDEDRIYKTYQIIFCFLKCKTGMGPDRIHVAFGLFKKG